jgi:tRNA (cytidine/uridine-2'-O-)-methyltransferase
VRFQPGDHLVFGAETTGLPDAVLAGAEGTPITIPMLDARRGLNLSTSVGIAAYEALRQIHG